MTRSSIPEDLDALTPRWLTGVLRQAGELGPDQSVTRVVRARGAGGIPVTSRVSRLLIDYEPATIRAPRSLFVKVSNPDYDGHDLCAREVRFYRDLAAFVDLPVPRCFHADVDDEARRFVLLLEDLTDAAPGHPLEGCDLAQTRQVLDDLARLHAAWWESDRLRQIDWPRMPFDPDKIAGYVRSFRGAWADFAAAGKYRVDVDLDARTRGTSDETFVGARRRLLDPPTTLIHTDLHVENMLFDEREGESRVWFIDWQSARAGNPAWDFAYALGGNTKPEVLGTHGEALLERYHERLTARSGIEYDRLRVTEDYRAAVRWMYFGQVLFLAEFTPATDHDLRTLQMEWDRVAQAFASLA